MKGTWILRMCGVLLGAASLCGGPTTLAQGPSAIVTVFATGLSNPHGLKFGPDGNLYVAEAGSPTGDIMEAFVGLGTDCSVGKDIPGDRYRRGTTGSRISRIDANGNVTTFVDNLPSDESVPARLDSGVADVAFIGDTLYAILAGAGCSHGVPTIPNAVIRINPDHSWTIIADLGAFSAESSGGQPHRSDHRRL